MEELLDKIATCVEVGKINLKTPFPPAMKGLPGAEELTLQALEAGIAPADILTHGLIVGMERIGVKFKNNQVFVPQVLMSAKAMGTATTYTRNVAATMSSMVSTEGSASASCREARMVQGRAMFMTS